MKLNINDFPIGTNINVNYYYPITDYYNDTLPRNYNVSFNSSPQFYASTSNYCPLLLQKIDFSKVENLYLFGQNFNFNVEDMVFNLSNCKYFNFYQTTNNSLYKTPKTFTYNFGDKVEEINYTIKNNYVVDNVTFNGTSTKLKKINSTFDSLKTKELYFNIDCSNVTNCSPFYYSQQTDTTFFNGFPNLKCSIDSYYALEKFPNLTRESYLSIFNNLYNFTENNETPSSSQGKLKISTNAQNVCTEEDFNIPISKSWVILFA